ncbi:dihydrofolate reductase family protein [Leifsonia sp. C5G2]|uniref:dihydrofolate reductase family protein n=1 Tax=Leifsonia sp. C5G2 TaxID=2735269 RepID=UPI00158476EF|nr:dihydrofolate reductase family protein [Leifsonia sp. C5G2]NUU05664.1 dihydrofolate reductase [Leifsonia sp. C5G2]
MLLSVVAFVSLDGVVQGPAARDEDRSGGFTRGGWLVPHASPALDAVVRTWMGQAGALLVGRNTFERMCEHWSEVADPGDAVVSVLTAGPVFVVSSTIPDDEVGATTTLIRGDPVAAVRALREQPGGELQVHGSWRLTRTLHDAGLVDSYRLVQVPVVIGQGKRLFEAGAVPALYRVDAAESVLLERGAVALTLRRERSAASHPGRHAVTAATPRHAVTGR